MLGSKTNSKNKNNISFAAMGNYQIEFFDIDGVRYFSAYFHQSEGSREIVLDLGDVKITNMGQTGYKMVTNRNTYTLEFLTKRDVVETSLTQKLWHWLPLRRFKGKLSNAGLATIRSEFEPHIVG